MIAIVKSINGEFFIGKLSDQGDQAKLLEAYNLVIHRNPQTNAVASTIMPIMFPFDNRAIKEIRILNNFVGVVKTPPDAEKAYIKLTSGIDIVSSNIQLQ